MKIKLDNYQSDLSSLLIDVINNDNFYKIMLKYFKNENKNKLDIIFKDSNTYFSLNKMEIINILKKIEEIDLNKFLKLKELVSYEKVKDDYINKNFNYFFERIPSKILFDFLELEHEEFITKCDEKIINDFERNKFLNIIFSFIEKYRFENNYDINDNIKLNIEYLKKYHNDMSVENIYNKEPGYMKKIELNSKFKDNILKDVPAYFNNFEKAFYIYYKLCSILTYDEGIFGFKGKIDSKEIKHSSIKRIKEINENNNKIVCFEFNAIFAKFLKELGIKYSFNVSSKYGIGHNSINFFYKGATIKVDSLEQSVIHSDLAHAKNNIKFSGFNIIAGSEEARERCEESKNMVYQYIKEHDHKSSKTYIEIINQMKEGTDEYMSLDDKVRLYFEKISSIDVPATDKLENLILLRKSLFDKSKNFETYFVKNNYKNSSKINVIFVYLKENGDRKYFILDENKNIDSITLEDINASFASGKFTYCGDDYANIPGISLESKHKKI